ncbi:MAG: hypothetical protein ACE5HA_13180 [Anaerolineae bacterium]
MKTYRNLYPRVCDWDNIYLAYRKARKGKRGRPPAASFEYHLESNLVELNQQLVAKTYTPGDYHSFYIHEPKRRLISAAPFRDRVVHHALCNIIEPIFWSLTINPLRRRQSADNPPAGNATGHNRRGPRP